MPVYIGGSEYGVGYYNSTIPPQYQDLTGLITATIDPRLATGSGSLTDGQVRFFAVSIHKTSVITGAGFIQGTQGAYTADNNNKIGLYKSDGTSLNRVASTDDDANLWKGSANTLQTKAFSSPYTATPGAYWIGIVYNSSAQTTAPTILGSTTLPGNGAAHDIQMNDGDELIGCYIASQTDLDASEAWSGLAAAGPVPFLFLY